MRFGVFGLAHNTLGVLAQTASPVLFCSSSVKLLAASPTACCFMPWRTCGRGSLFPGSSFSYFSQLSAPCPSELLALQNSFSCEALPCFGPFPEAKLTVSIRWEGNWGKKGKLLSTMGQELCWGHRTYKASLKNLKFRKGTRKEIFH